MILFCDISIINRDFAVETGRYVGVEGKTITYIGEQPPADKCTRIIDGSGKLLLPAFYNPHTHSAMTLLRGMGEDLPLDDWLHNVIFPAEAHLEGEHIYAGTLLACAEMLKYGIVSCSDMYFFGSSMANAFIDAGIKANISPNVVNFDPTQQFCDLPQYGEYKQLLSAFSGHETIKIDMSLHSEYATKEKCVRTAAEFAAENGMGMHIHVSETKTEHRGCIERHGITPIEYLDSLGVFDVRTTAAHCVWATERDMDILNRRGVVVASCPQSNLKLGSGICNYKQMLEHNVTVAVATDSAASNNNLNMLKEARLMALLSKGMSQDASVMKTSQAIYSATRAGALAQGRTDCGIIEIGAAADIAVFELDMVNTVPCTTADTSLLYSLDGEAYLTMCNGRILYENGAYTTIDLEKVKAMARKASACIC